jgi:putative transposase
MSDMNCPYLNKNMTNLMNKLYMPKNNIKFHKNKKYTYIATSEFPDDYYKLSYKHMNIKSVSVLDLTKQRDAKIKSTQENNNITTKKKEIKIKGIITKYKKKIDNIGNVLRSYKIKIELEPFQKKKIFEWFKVCDYVYNKCVLLFNKNADEFLKMSKSNFFKKIFGNSDKGAPYDMLTNEFRTFRANVKSAISNEKNGNQKHFTMKNKSTKNGRTILIPYRSIKENGFFSTELKNIKDFKKKIDVNKIKCDCELNYDKSSNKWYFIVSEYINKKNIIERKEEVAIDEGESIFATFYSPEECGKCGENLRKPILRIQERIKHLQSTIKKGINKKGRKLKNKGRLIKIIKRHFKKIKHIVDEVHHQTAKYLCENYKRILVPKFETKKMVLNNYGTTRKDKKRINKLNGRVKFVLMRQSHFRFKMFLKAKGEEYGCDIIDCTEEYTSQCCGKCGHLSTEYTGRTKRCTKCGYKINRDLNGARNIFVKNHKYEK